MFIETAMHIEMIEVGVFRVLLTFQGMMNQQIEAARIGVAIYNRQVLPLVEKHQFMHCITKFGQ
jgi:hypothetical protein